jgi:hypothetical protein
LIPLASQPCEGLAYPPPSNSVQLDAQEQVDKPTEHAGSKWQHSRRHARQLIGGLTFGIPACGRFKPSEKSAKGWRWLRSQRCGTQAKGQASSSLSLASRATWRWLVRLTDDGRQVAIAAAATRHLVGALSTSTKRRGNRLVSTAIRAKTEFATKTSLRPDGVPRAQGQAARCTHFLISSSTRRRTQARIHIPTVMILRSVRGGGDAARVRGDIRQSHGQPRTRMVHVDSFGAKRGMLPCSFLKTTKDGGPWEGFPARLDAGRQGNGWLNGARPPFRLRPTRSDIDEMDPSFPSCSCAKCRLTRNDGVNLMPDIASCAVMSKDILMISRPPDSPRPSPPPAYPRPLSPASTTPPGLIRPRLPPPPPAPLFFLFSLSFLSPSPLPVAGWDSFLFQPHVISCPQP